MVLIGRDFPISTAYEAQYYPVVIFANDQYYVFWEDYRLYYSDKSIYAARVTTDGTVIDPDGKLILSDRTVIADIAFDGVNFLVAIQDSC
ncbi:hypothetical protein KAX97_01745 [candidate division WOR-3 bacterium]|nr:hypothetical protein [candidate division WOR-3 bacterium]